MENQTNYPSAPQVPQENSSGANTVLLVIIILLILGGGYWWYMHRHAAAPAQANPSSIKVDVNLPASNPPSTTTTQTTQ